jgi:hypothetical protein
MSEKSDYQKHLESLSETEYKRLTQGNWSTEQDTRVRCTADGEFPLKGEMVIFEIEGDDAWIGGCESYDLDCGSFWFGSDDIETDFYPITEPIYWKPLTGLKEQYERERE